MNKPDNKKTLGREFALKFLFQLFIKDNAPFREAFVGGDVSASELEERIMDFKESYMSPDDEHPDNQIDDGNFFFANKLLVSLSKEMNKVEELVKLETKKEHLEHLEKIERCVLLVGTIELTEFETPYQVVINEMVNLAKKYGGADSGRFVNGVLDGIRRKQK